MFKWTGWIGYFSLLSWKVQSILWQMIFLLALQGVLKISMPTVLFLVQPDSKTRCLQNMLSFQTALSLELLLMFCPWPLCFSCLFLFLANLYPCRSSSVLSRVNPISSKKPKKQNIYNHVVFFFIFSISLNNSKLKFSKFSFKVFCKLAM